MSKSLVPDHARRVNPRRGALCVPPGNDFAMTLRKGEIASENPLSVIQLGG
jgi:hypothetical protein